MRQRRVIVLGATGSIGQSAAKVAADLPDRMRIVGMSAHRSAAALAEQANRFRPEALCLVDESGLPELRAKLAPGYAPTIFAGEAGSV